jgi:Fe-S-cluster-containing hydrogenase component 2
VRHLRNLRAICPADAIRVSEFRVEILPELCVRCGACAVVCPTRAIREAAE